jgi:hypothetical protein
MEYLAQVKVSKEDFLALSGLAGDMSIMDYMSKIIHEHVVAQKSAQLTATGRVENLGAAESGGA